MRVGDLTPAFVQHCQLPNSAIGWFASLMKSECRMTKPERNPNDETRRLPLSFVLRHLLFFRSFVIRHWSFLLLACALWGCSTPSKTVTNRHFDFQKDTFA